MKYLLANSRNRNYLNSVKLNLEFIRPTCKIETAISASEDIAFAVPSAHLETTVTALKEKDLRGKSIYVSIKGIVSHELLVPSAFLAKKFARHPKEITVLAGPCHAEEIAMDRKTFLTISGENKEVVLRLASSIHSNYIKVIKSADPLGVEYASIMKNVIGIASGLVKGLNYGDNFLAVVISNSMREIKNLLQAIDDVARDLYNSAYFGDLLVTAYSELSRNRTFGDMIGRGYSISNAKGRMSMVAEGIPAVKGMHRISQMLEVKMPVLSAVYRILYKHTSPFIEFKLLESYLI